VSGWAHPASGEAENNGFHRGAGLDSPGKGPFGKVGVQGGPEDDAMLNTLSTPR